MVLEDFECGTRCYLNGLATGSIIFSGMFFAQKALTKGLSSRGAKSVSRSGLLASSGIFAAISAYLVIKQGLVECQKSALQAKDTKIRNQKVVQSS